MCLSPQVCSRLGQIKNTEQSNHEHKKACCVFQCEHCLLVERSPKPEQAHHKNGPGFVKLASVGLSHLRCSSKGTSTTHTQDEAAKT
eukprot:3575308-Amphidinium_carterae.1